MSSHNIPFDLNLGADDRTFASPLLCPGSTLEVHVCADVTDILCKKWRDPGWQMVVTLQHSGGGW